MRRPYDHSLEACSLDSRGLDMVLQAGLPLTPPYVSSGLS